MDSLTWMKKQPRRNLIGAAPSCRHSHRKRYSKERYARFIPSLGQGWPWFPCDNVPKASRTRWHCLDTECHRTNFSQGCYGSSILGIGRIFKLPLEEQQLWIPNQLDRDPDSWTDPNLIQLKSEYGVLFNTHRCKVQEESRRMVSTLLYT